MAKETVLARVKVDLERGDLGKARDRLHSLINEYPEDLGLRACLADVYHRLLFPAMAGRYWYLEERGTPEMEDAIAAFERSCGGDPLLTLSALKFRGDPNSTPAHAHDRLLALRQAGLDKYGSFPEVYPRSRVVRRGRGSLPPRVQEAMWRVQRESFQAMRRRRFLTSLSQGYLMVGRSQVPFHIVFLGMAMVTVAGIGLFTIASWVFRAF